MTTNNSQIDISEASPFLKWVGGKRKLIPTLDPYLPNEFKRSQYATYIEPFVGGGAMLFHVLKSYRNIKRAVINDKNEHLIRAYRAVRNNCSDVISTLRIVEMDYMDLSEEDKLAYFLEVRDAYNAGGFNDNDGRAAARLIFLNKTCFNGLFRVNGKGQFNTSFGRNNLKQICNAKQLLHASRLLRRVEEITCCDFTDTLKHATPSSVYYIDPPYKPTSPTADFTAYTQGSFKDLDQERVAEFCRAIDDKGGSFIANNSNLDSDYFYKLYDGFHINKISSTHTISCKASSRGRVLELVITNIKPEDRRNDAQASDEPPDVQPKG